MEKISEAMSTSGTSHETRITFLERRLAYLESQEKLLTKENILLRQLYERAPLGYQSLDENGCFLSINTAWLEALGYDKAEVLGKNFSDFLHPDWQDHFRNNFPRFKSIGEILGVEFEMVKKDGGRILVSFHGKIGKNPQGDFQQTHCIFQDITELRQVQEEYKRFFDLVPDMVCIISADGCFKRVNDSWCSVLGYSERELLAAPFSELIHPDDREMTLAMVERQVDGEPIEQVNNRFRHKDGSYRWFEWRAAPARGDNSLYAMARDVTDRRSANEHIRKRELFLRTILETTLDGFLVLNTDGVIAEVNEAYCTMLGYSKEELLGLHINSIDGIEVPEQTRERIRRIAADGSELFETGHRHKDGAVMPVEISTTFLPDEEGGRFVCFSRDLTERKRAEKEMKDLQAQLAQAQKMEAIGTLAGGIAHDFNNILGAILGYAEMAREDCLAGEVRSSDLEKIIEAGNRAKALVKQILTFSRQTEAEKVSLRPAPLLEETLELLRASIPTTISIEQYIDHACYSILADPIQIHQIMLNLCTNAYHSMESQGGVLSVSLKNRTLSRQDFAVDPALLPGEYVELCIRDTGTGMPEGIRRRIFDPYFTTKETGKGTGMGLAIVHGLVKSYGGAVSCESEVDVGTVFTILLPAITDHMITQTKFQETIPRGTESILIVDDEQMIVEICQVLLERLGYKVTAVTSSTTALAVFADRPADFDLVMTDQAMPEMSGLELAKRILQIRNSIPIILCTGYSSLISNEKLREVGISGLAFKPLTKKDVALLVRKVLDKGKSETEEKSGKYIRENWDT
jgi:PAS domain S-box-containing protein